jgi:hypothetical protein
VELKYSQKDNGLYVLSRGAIDNIAKDILTEFSPHNLTSPIPLNTTAFLDDYLGLLEKSKYIGTLEVGCLGLTVMADLAEIPTLDTMFKPCLTEETYGTVLISPYLNGPENRGRKRYTEAHEGSHWVLHRPYFQRNNSENYVACRSVERVSDARNDAKSWMEWQADTLAAALLMPRDVFYDYGKVMIQRAGVRCGYLRTDVSRDKGVFYEIIEDITSQFKVSARAAQIRMLHTGLIDPQVL